MNFSRLILATSFAAMLCAPATVRAESWTLSQALEAAAKNNPDVRLAQFRIEGAAALEQQSRAGLLPQLSLQGSYGASNRAMAAFGSILNQRAFVSGTDFNHPGTIDNLSVSGTLAYTLYSGGRVNAQRNAARAGVEAAQQEAERAQQEVQAAVVRSYLNIRQAREAALTVDAGVHSLELSLTVAQHRFDSGQLLKAELLNLEVQLASLREAQSTAKHLAALAERAFLLLLGQEKAASVELGESDPSLDLLSIPQNTDFSGRPDVLAMQARVRAAEALVRAQRGERRPTVNAFASYGYDQGWKLDRHADGWNAGVAVDFNVFDGGRTGGKIRAAKADLEQSRELLRKLELGVALQVEQARLAHEDAARRLEVSARTVAQAEESASLSRARFNEGALLSSDLIGVETRLIEARLRRTLAGFDERLALVQLRRALGRPLFDSAK